MKGGTTGRRGGGENRALLPLPLPPQHHNFAFRQLSAQMALSRAAATGARVATTRAPRPAVDTTSPTTRARRRTHNAAARDDGPSSPSSPPPSPSPAVASLPALALAGATLGPILDGIHSSVGLQVYDLLPVDLGPLHSSALVPLLLAAFYVVLASLDAALEAFLPSSSPSPAPPPSTPVVACYAALAAGLTLSATLHSQGDIPPPTIAACLALFSAANWWLFDRTPRGLALAVLCAVVAPLAEAQLMARFGSWHYPRADVVVPVLFAGAGGAASSVGFVSWVPFCYCFYAPSVLQLGRRLRARAREEAAARQVEGRKM